MGQAPEARLTLAGAEQAQALAGFLVAAAADAPIERIVSSPFARARESVEPLAARLGLPVETDARLCERLLTTEARLDWREQLRASFDDPALRLTGGESGRAATARAVAIVGDVRRHPAATTVLVTHGNLLTLLLRHFDPCFGFEAWCRLANPDVFRLALDALGGRGARIEHLWREAHQPPRSRPVGLAGAGESSPR